MKTFLVGSVNLQRDQLWWTQFELAGTFGMSLWALIHVRGWPARFVLYQVGRLKEIWYGGRGEKV